MSREHETEELVQDLEEGCTRSRIDERYDLVPFCGLRRTAGRFALGADKHGEGDWKNGQRPQTAINHMIKHLYHYKELLEEGYSPKQIAEMDDDIAAIAWGAFALMWYEENMPELFPLGKKELTHAELQIIRANSLPYEEGTRILREMEKEMRERHAKEREEFETSVGPARLKYGRVTAVEFNERLRSVVAGEDTLPELVDKPIGEAQAYFPHEEGKSVSTADTIPPYPCEVCPEQKQAPLCITCEKTDEWNDKYDA